MTNLKNLEGKSISSVGDSLVKHFQSQEDDLDLKILEELCSLKLLGRPNKSELFIKLNDLYNKQWIFGEHQYHNTFQS